VPTLCYIEYRPLLFIMKLVSNKKKNWMRSFNMFWCINTKALLSFCWQKCQTNVFFFRKWLHWSLCITSLKPSETIIIQLPELQYETFVRGRFNLRRSNIEHPYTYVWLLAEMYECRRLLCWHFTYQLKQLNINYRETLF